MKNQVDLTCILAHRDDISFYVNSNNCFVRCVGIDTSNIPLDSFLEITGSICNLVTMNTIYTAIYVQSLKIIP